MSQLTTLLRSLGPAGAAANARSALDERLRDEWVVDGLLRRIDPVTAPTERPLEPAASRVA